MRGRLPRRELAVGAVFGLAWAAAMRGMMAELAARDPGGSHFSIATFIFILPPGAVTGALMAWAITPPRPGVMPAPQRLRWAPMVMCLDPAAVPIMLAVVGAGWVAGGRGTPRSRLWIGIPSALMLLALPVAIAIDSPPAWASLRSTWILTLATSLLASLVIVETMVVRRLALTAAPHIVGAHESRVA
ncbi:hypothetical protein [Nostocoides sp. HKS02]|uniref:hypothetical protein n=1 Tax=Nostocoides sp. HKS02 TaxID=1813880 RepID=UPI0012B44954|nr:hypothetical protein [Tetrasphaera sp. HKS02]QGN58266.1 hypothetical protein GKE56_10650 [Tetrasphaera sp. HKS02]